MSLASTHYVSPKLVAETCSDRRGRGLFAATTLAAGETLVVWGGAIVTSKDLRRLPSAQQCYSLQVEEDLYLVSPPDGEIGDWVNHSCDPNAGLSGQVVLVARRTIAPGEEICYDYAMSDGSPYDEFVCHCGSVHCRGKVTGNDWQLSTLQNRYAGYFAPYLQRRIDQQARDKEKE